VANKKGEDGRQRINGYLLLGGGGLLMGRLDQFVLLSPTGSKGIGDGIRIKGLSLSLSLHNKTLFCLFLSYTRFYQCLLCVDSITRKTIRTRELTGW
jgi:hypothetical protein